MKTFTRILPLLLSSLSLASAEDTLKFSDPSPQRYLLKARASVIDPRAREHPEIEFVFEKKGKPADEENAAVDTRVAPRGRLVIWLMGHSNGGISQTEFLKYLEKKKGLDLVQGVIASGIRNESDFAPPTRFPMLFIHHEQDGCSNTRYAAARALYEKIRPQARQPVEFRTLSGGSPEAAHPCSSGHHMYHGASDEAVQAIDDFIARMSP